MNTVTKAPASSKQPAPAIDPAKENAKIDPGGKGPVGPNEGANVSKETARGAPGAPGKSSAP
jgi:hypothetical protein